MTKHLETSRSTKPFESMSTRWRKWLAFSGCTTQPSAWLPNESPKRRNTKN